MEQLPSRLKKLVKRRVPSKKLPLIKVGETSKKINKKQTLFQQNITDYIDKIINENSLNLNKTNINKANVCQLISPVQPVTTIEPIKNIHKDVAVQTSNPTDDNEITRLKFEIKKAKEKLFAKKYISSTRRKSLEQFFTLGQINKMEKPDKKVNNWSSVDIRNAMTLYAAGPQAYMLLCKKNYPFPAASTIRKWYNKINAIQGQQMIKDKSDVN